MPKASLNMPPLSGVADKNVQSALQTISNWSRALAADYVSYDELKLRDAKEGSSVNNVTNVVTGNGGGSTVVTGGGYSGGLYQVPLWVRGELAINLPSTSPGTGQGNTKDAPLSATLLGSALGTNSIGVAAYAPSAPTYNAPMGTVNRYITNWGGIAGSFYGDTGIIVDTTRRTNWTPDIAVADCVENGDAIKSFGTVRIIKPAHVMDGYGGGLLVERDASACAGGIHGWTNTAVYAKTTAGAAETQFEWTGLFVMDNKSTAGENVAVYGQGNQIGTGPTWGACFEVRGVNEYSAGMLTAAELHCSAMGSITTEHKTRYGALAVLSDYRFKTTGGSEKSTAVEGAAGVLITTDEFGGANSDHIKWHRGVQTMGNFGTLLDFTESKYTKGIDTKEGAPFRVHAQLQVLPPNGSSITEAQAGAGFGVWWGHHRTQYNSLPNNDVVNYPTPLPPGIVNCEGVSVAVGNGGTYFWTEPTGQNTYNLVTELWNVATKGSYDNPFSWSSDTPRETYSTDNGLWWKNKEGAKYSVPDMLVTALTKGSHANPFTSIGTDNNLWWKNSGDGITYDVPDLIFDLMFNPIGTVNNPYTDGPYTTWGGAGKLNIPEVVNRILNEGALDGRYITKTGSADRVAFTPQTHFGVSIANLQDVITSVVSVTTLANSLASGTSFISSTGLANRVTFTDGLTVDGHPIYNLRSMLDALATTYSAVGALQNNANPAGGSYYIASNGTTPAADIRFPTVTGAYTGYPVSNILHLISALDSTTNLANQTRTDLTAHINSTTASGSYLPLAGGTVTGVTTFNNLVYFGTATGTKEIGNYLAAVDTLYGGQLGSGTMYRGSYAHPFPHGGLRCMYGSYNIDVITTLYNVLSRVNELGSNPSTVYAPIGAAG